MRIACWLLLGLLSCNTERQLQKAETRLAAAGRLAQVCAERYPAKDSIIVRDSTSFDTIYTEGVIIDTLKKTDTLPVPGPIRVITRTVYRIKESYSTGSVQLEACRGQLAALNRIIASQQQSILAKDREIEEWKTKAKQRIWLWIIIGLLVGWIVRKPLAALFPFPTKIS